MIDINKFIFTRTAPKKKLEVVQKLTQQELLSISYATILRIIKEAGVGDSNKARNRFKTLFLSNATNGYNSSVSNLYIWKKAEIYLSVYIQGDDTDTEVEYKLRDFLDNRYEEHCFGHLEESFRNGYSHKVPANYDRHDRAEVVKAILVAYITNKYAGKLS